MTKSVDVAYCISSQLMCRVGFSEAHNNDYRPCRTEMGMTFVWLSVRRAWYVNCNVSLSYKYCFLCLLHVLPLLEQVKLT